MSGLTGDGWRHLGKPKGRTLVRCHCRCLFGTDRWGLLHFVYLHQPFDGLCFGGIGSDLLGAGLGGVGGLGFSFLHMV